MWNRSKSPLRIEKRFEFDNYQKISKFMKLVDDLCEKTSIYPNISFGKNFISFTIFLENEKKINSEIDFSKRIDEIFEQI
tara:strand:+ start:289 stop:528 length:240 start_codon:yes stop_codon:yes gene_type:complete